MSMKNLITENSLEFEEIREVKKAVASFFKVPVEEIDGKDRTVPLPSIRHVAMSLSYKIAGVSLWDLTFAFNRSNHHSICHAITATRERCQTEPKFREQVEQAEALARLAVKKVRARIKI